MRPLYPPRSLRSRPSQREGGLDVLDVGKTSDKVSSDRIAKQHLPTKNDEGPRGWLKSFAWVVGLSVSFQRTA